jgi:cell division protein FtsA
MGYEEPVAVPQRYLAEVIGPRAREMAMLIGAEIERSGATVLPGGIVLTGGGAMLRGFAEMCQQVTDLPVHVAAPTGTMGMDDELHGPDCATVVGLLRWSARTGRRSAVRSNGHNGNNNGNGHHGVSERFSRWVRELF